MVAPKESLPTLRHGFQTPLVTDLDLASNGITNVVWATSYAFDFSLVKLPVLSGASQGDFPKSGLDVRVICGNSLIRICVVFNARFGFQSHSHVELRSHQLRRPLDPSRTPSAAPYAVKTLPRAGLRGHRG